MRILTLSFDDGFARSCETIARIHEKFGLSACFNVLAGAHLPDWISPDQYMIKETLGDFGMWNDLRARGHEIMPHGYRHANKAALRFGESRDLILRCLDVFDAKLKGFDRRRAVFNFPYNASTPFLEDWLSTQVRAIRAGASPQGLNPAPTPAMFKLHSTAWGPENCDADLGRCVNALLARPDGWLIYCLHGLDGQGWGPLSADYLERLLARLVQIPDLGILPAARVLEHVDLGRM